MSNKYKHKNKIFLALLLGIIPLTEIFSSSVKAIEFPDAPKREAPKATAAGGRRGGCVKGNLPITALTPSNDNYIQTASGKPPFFFYIPPTQAKFAQFTLKEENGKNLDFQEIPITESDKVIKVNVSDSVNLETDKKYQWEISLVCNPMFINTSNHTKGVIEKIPLNENAKKQLLENPDTLKQAQIYADFNIWPETISLVAKVKQSQPQQWQELLTSVGLENLLEKELINN